MNNKESSCTAKGSTTLSTSYGTVW